MRVVRTEDEVFRIGGEEFALVVEGPSAAAVQVADRVREALGEKRRGRSLPTVSAGVATFPDHARTAEDLHRKADIALYAAKFAGKDRVQVFKLDAEAVAVEREPAVARRRSSTSEG